MPTNGGSMRMPSKQVPSAFPPPPGQPMQQVFTCDAPHLTYLAPAVGSSAPWTASVVI